MVQEASQLADDELGAFLRREGLHESQLNEWIEVANAAALASLAPSKRSRAKKSPEARKIKALEKELNRKDRALAEVTAILALKKRVQRSGGTGATTRTRGAEHDPRSRGRSRGERCPP